MIRVCVCVRVKVCFGLGEFTCRCAHVCVCMCVKSTVNRRFITPLPLIPSGPGGCAVQSLAAVCEYVAPMFQHSLWLLRLLRGKTAGGSPKQLSLPSLISPTSYFASFLPVSVFEGSWCWKKLRHPLTFFTSASGCLLVSWLQAILIILDKQNTQNYTSEYTNSLRNKLVLKQWRQLFAWPFWLKSFT